MFGLAVAMFTLAACSNNTAPYGGSESSPQSESALPLSASDDALSDGVIPSRAVESYPAPEYPEWPPGELVDFEFRAVSLPPEVLNELLSLDATALGSWVYEVGKPSFSLKPMSFIFNNFEIHTSHEDTASDIELVSAGKAYRIFAANRPVYDVYWMDNHTLSLKTANAVYPGDIVYDYYSYDLSSGKVEKIALSYPHGESPEETNHLLQDYHVWYHGVHLFFGLSPQAEGPEDKQVFAQQNDGGYHVLADNIWDWHIYGGNFYYKDDASGRVYAVELNGENRRVIYTSESPYESIDAASLKDVEISIDASSATPQRQNSAESFVGDKKVSLLSELHGKTPKDVFGSVNAVAIQPK